MLFPWAGPWVKYLANVVYSLFKASKSGILTDVNFKLVFLGRGVDNGMSLMQDILMLIKVKILYYLTIQPLRDYGTHILGISRCSPYMLPANKAISGQIAKQTGFRHPKTSEASFDNS